MPIDKITVLGQEISTPLRFALEVPFSDSDRKLMPWLCEDIRFYNIESELGRGGRAIAYEGKVSEKSGKVKSKSPRIVLKIPNLDESKFTLEQIKDYLQRQEHECLREWRLTRKRLEDCKYANPIFDFSVIKNVEYLGELLPVPVSVQLHVDAKSLNQFLMDTNQRSEPYKSKRGEWHDNWNGMSDHKKWFNLVKNIAIGLADIHQRRIAHGDIWPPNIFISEDSNGIYPIFIDFGEAYAIEPKGDRVVQGNHAYRAPERSDARSIVTQQADVYSFGKLMLFLATGAEPTIPRDLKGSGRRKYIRQFFEDRNKIISTENPFIVDIICKCLTLDPVDRPTMIEIVAAFNSYIDTEALTSDIDLSYRIESLLTQWNSIINEDSKRSSISPFLEEIVNHKLKEIQVMINGLSSNVVNLTDTRERLIQVMISLFQRLDNSDRYISVTSPRMWQGPALGLDGRYLTVTELAASRGASVQRAFVFSIQELGIDWSNQFADNLENLFTSNHIQCIGHLSNQIKTASKDYLSVLAKGDTREIPQEQRAEAIKRFSLVMNSYSDISKGISRDKFTFNSHYRKFSECHGIFVGLLPVATLSDVQKIKSSNPVSVFHFQNADIDNQYLLMMTDCVGRSSRIDMLDSSLDSVPELRGLTIFKSVLGVPEDRIKKMEEIFRQSSNVGYWIESLCSCIPPP